MNGVSSSAGLPEHATQFAVTQPVAELLGKPSESCETGRDPSEIAPVIGYAHLVTCPLTDGAMLPEIIVRILPPVCRNLAEVRTSCSSISTLAGQGTPGSWLRRQSQ